MATGTILYHSDIQGLSFQPIELSYNDPSIVKSEVKIENESRLIVTFWLEKVGSRAEAISKTKLLAELISSRISFKYNCPIGEPRPGECWSNDDTNNNSLALKCVLGMQSNIDSCVRLGEQPRLDLRKILEKPVGDVDRYLGLYRFAVNQADPISRFLFLYNLMLMIVGDKQANVDKKIRGIDNSVHQTPSGGPNAKAGKTETIYTRLRNEISHCRLNTTYRKTADEIIIHVGFFRK